MIGTNAVILKTILETVTSPGDFYDSENQIPVVKFLQFETNNSVQFTTVITALLPKLRYLFFSNVNFQEAWKKVHSMYSFQVKYRPVELVLEL